MEGILKFTNVRIIVSCKPLSKPPPVLQNYFVHPFHIHPGFQLKVVFLKSHESRTGKTSKYVRLNFAGTKMQHNKPT